MEEFDNWLEEEIQKTKGEVIARFIVISECLLCGKIFTNTDDLKKHFKKHKKEVKK